MEVFHHLTVKKQPRQANWETYCSPCKRKWEKYYTDLGWAKDDTPHLEYLTPELIQIFKQSEIFRMESKLYI